MEVLLTIEAYCWLYAAGCVDWLHQTGKIDEKEYAYWRRFMDDNVTPPAEKIRERFPKPFRFAETLEEMIAYWRKRHVYNEDEKTPVILAEVLTYEFLSHGKKFVKVKAFFGKGKYKIHAVENIHRYDLKPGNSVLIHGNIVAESAS